MNGACAARDGAVPADLFQYWQFTWSNIKLKYSKLHFKVINHIIMCEGLTFQPMSLISLISLVEDINWSSSHAHMFLLEVKMYSSGFGLMIPVWSNTFSEMWMNGWKKECLYDVSEKKMQKFVGSNCHDLAMSESLYVFFYFGYYFIPFW